jgi:hypothetical protein
MAPHPISGRSASSPGPRRAARRWVRRGRRRVLLRIEQDLATSDPHLMALFRTFTLLARDERMPRAERIAAWPLRMLSRLRRRPWRHRGRPHRVRRHRAGEGWGTAVLTIIGGAVALVAVAFGCMSSQASAGSYPHRW